LNTKKGERRMGVKKVVNRALKDPKFADELRKRASKAGRDGVGSQAEADFTAFLADSAGDLAALGGGVVGPGPGTSIHKLMIAELLGALKKLQG
jgi:hypothetical protein